MVQIASPPHTLRRTLGFFGVTVAGVGVIIGAGVYALIGPAASRAGNAVWLAFLLAAVVAGFTAYSYARFAALVPKNSPEFQYTSLAFGTRVGFAAGWLMVWSDIIATAAVALGFGGYLFHLSDGLLPTAVSALILVTVLSLIVLWGIEESVWFVAVLTGAEVIGLVLIAAIGLPAWGEVNLLEARQGISGIWSAAALVFFAFIGFDEIGNLAEETREPERVLPRALAVSLIVSTLLYMTVSVSAVSVAGWEDIGASDAPLALVASKALGLWADLVLTIIALAATASTVLLLLLAGSRSLHAMAVAGALPPRLGLVGRRGTPWVATLIVAVIVAAATLAGNLETVAEVTNGVILMSFFAVDLALFWVLRRRKEGRSYVRFVLLDMSPPLAASALCVVLLFYTGWVAILFGLALGAIGVLVNIAFSRRSYPAA
jgi:APA family basic amino acid/polyamine antiporter